MTVIFLQTNVIRVNPADISRENSPWRKNEPLSARKAAIKRLIALNHSSLRLIETMGGNRRFGPDIYYHVAFCRCIVVRARDYSSPNTARYRVGYVRGCLGGWMRKYALACVRCARVRTLERSQPRRSSSHEPFTVRTSLVTRSGIRKHSH